MIDQKNLIHIVFLVTALVMGGSLMALYFHSLMWAPFVISNLSW